jgi:hypothetical protein
MPKGCAFLLALAGSYVAVALFILGVLAFLGAFPVSTP